MTVTKYIHEEQRALLDGERLLPPRALCARWGIKPRTLQEWTAGERRDGIVLKAFRPSPRVTRYRVRDVLEFEARCGLSTAGHPGDAPQV